MCADSSSILLLPRPEKLSQIIIIQKDACSPSLIHELRLPFLGIFRSCLMQYNVKSEGYDCVGLAVNEKWNRSRSVVTAGVAYFKMD